MSDTKPLFTLAQFQQITGATPEDAKKHYQPVLNALLNFGLTDKKVIASFLATIAIESGNLRLTKEDLYYKDAERLAKLFMRVFDQDQNKKISPEEIAYAEKFTKNSAALNKKLYDGFCGRGVGQVTWRGNYVKVGNLLGLDFVNHPEKLEQPVEGAMAAAALFVDFGMPAVAGNHAKSREIWNGPAKLKTKEHGEFYDLALKVLG